jgi:hypothetical protein
MTRSCLRLTAAALLLALASASVSRPVCAQIASPSNAGQNSGNNASPSSTVPLATSEPPEVLVGCSGYGVSGFQGCSQESIDNLKLSFQTIFSSTETSKETNLVLQVLSVPDPIDPSLLGVGPQASSNQFSNPLQPRFNTEAANLFAMQSIKLGLDPSSAKLGLELVALGVPIQPALQLVSALQGLASSPTYNALSNSIRAFNAVVKASPVSVRKQLDTDEDFIEISNSLRTVRTAVVIR